MSAGRWRRICRGESRLFENKCYMRMIGISHIEHKINEYVAYGNQVRLLSTVKHRKLSWFGHVMPKIILQRTVDSSRRRGRPCKSWKDNTKKWTGQPIPSLLRIANDRGRWPAKAAAASVGYPNDTWACRELVSYFAISTVSHFLGNRYVKYLLLLMTEYHILKPTSCASRWSEA